MCDEIKYEIFSSGCSFNSLRDGHFSCKFGRSAVRSRNRSRRRKPKQILNETRTAIESNDDPGELTQLDLADEVTSGDSNMSASINMTNTTAIVTS